MLFYRIDHPTIQSGKVVRYRQVKGFRDEAEISASRDGVIIQGSWPHLRNGSIQDVIDVLNRANEQAEVLRRGSGPLSWVSEPPCVIELRESHFGAEDEVIRRRELPG